MLRRPLQLDTAFRHNVVLRSAFESFYKLKPSHPSGAVIKEADGRSFQHSKLFADACLCAHNLHQCVWRATPRAVPRPGRSSQPNNVDSFLTQHGARCVGIGLPPGYDFCVALLAVWLARCVAVPLNANATPDEMEHMLSLTGSKIVMVASPNSADGGKMMMTIGHSDKKQRKRITVDFASRGSHSLTEAHRVAVDELVFEQLVTSNNPGNLLVDAFSDAVIVGTSGTTGKPKGTVHSHASVSNQVNVLLSAWGWAERDSLLHTLPLHHVHGLVNGVCCGLAARAQLDFAHFDAASIVQRLSSTSPAKKGGANSLFFSVPAGFNKIIKQVESSDSDSAAAFKAAAQKNVRLFVSGSSAAPLPLLSRFKELSGHTLLERMGSTEMGMILSQSLEGRPRVAGSVGLPLPTVDVRALPPKDEAGEEGDIAELFVRSPSAFSRYWADPDKTKEAFVDLDGTGRREWFDTGDTVRVLPSGDFVVCGRASADICKIAGYKVSTIEVENELLDSGLIDEVAVFAASSGDNVTADSEMIAIMTPSAAAKRQLPNPAALIENVSQTLSEKLSSYKRPRRYLIALDGLERNAMGKVNKKDLAKKVEQLTAASESFKTW